MSMFDSAPVVTVPKATRVENRLHSALMRVRPAQLGDVLKRIVGVRRTVVTANSGHLFCVDPVSIFGMHLLSTGIYEADLTRILMTLVRPLDVFVDLGGNEGYFSVIAASQIAGGAVHCVEPQRRLREPLQRNFELNGSKVIIHECAVSNEDGYVDLFLRPSTNTGASSMFRHWKLGSKSERVACVTVDSLFQRHSIARARVIKIDAEGAEPLTVEGGRRVLGEHRADFIAMEYHPSICRFDRCRDTHRQLRDAGYILSTVSGQRLYHLPSSQHSLRPFADLVVNAPFV